MPDEETMELHVVMGDSFDVVFHPPSVTFFKVNHKVANILKSYVEGHKIETCAAIYDCTCQEVKRLLQKLQEEIVRQAARHPVSTMEPKDQLGRLTLLISQDCNLQCIYCYADGGSYGKARKLMSKKVAIRAMDLFTRESEFRCGYIMFFGGEPSLNVPVMRAVCEHLAEMVDSKRLPNMPELGMVTNGIHISDELLSLITEYGIGITVSLDGPPEVNDLQRVDLGGKGTYRQVVRSIRRLQQATEGREPKMIEATVTKRHLDLSMTYHTLVDFFTTELGIGWHRIGLETSLPDEERNSWSIAIRTSVLDKLIQGKFEPVVDDMRVLSTLVFKKIMPYMCSIGFSKLLVDAEGGIYPCQRFVSDPFYMGSVFEPNVLTSKRFERIRKTLRANTKYEHPQCRTCWARPVCAICPGEILDRTGTLDGRTDTLCNSVKRSLEIVLLELARLRTDPVLWPQIVAQLDNNLTG